MATDVRANVGSLNPPADHAVHIGLPHWLRRESAAQAFRRSKEEALGVVEPSTIDVRVQVVLQVVMARHLVQLAALLMQPNPSAAPLHIDILQPHLHRGAHPRNDLRTGTGYLEVQRQDGDKWQTIAHDWDPETTFRWLRTGGALSPTSEVTIDWRVPADAAPTETISTRRFLTRMHLAHGYPSSGGPRWWWAVIVDMMAGIMVFWALTGLVMWWAIKATRRAGFAVLVLSGVAAGLLASGMHRVIGG